MKIHVLSDLHVEFGDFSLPETDADVIVFAGDIGVGVDGLNWIKDQNIEKPVIYILGNHEYYHHDMALIDEIKGSASSHIHVLDNDAIEIDGVRFLGTTLWTDFLLFGEADKYFSVHHAKKGMSDFEVIRLNGKRFLPEDSIKLHEKSRDWLRCMLSIPFEGNTVVITHHLPSFKSVHARYAKNLLTPAFASNLEELMDSKRVSLWIHGHTHDAYDYEIFGTRIVCNPRGYFGYERSDEFRPGLVVQI